MTAPALHHATAHPHQAEVVDLARHRAARRGVALPPPAQARPLWPLAAVIALAWVPAVAAIMIFARILP